MNNLRIECKSCRTLWKIIGTGPKLKGRLTINPLTSICYLCEKEWGLPPPIPNLYQWNALQKQWELVNSK